MVLSETQKIANSMYFISLISIGHNFIWKDYMIIYPIVNNKYTCPDKRAYRLMMEHTTSDFMRDYVVRPN